MRIKRKEGNKVYNLICCIQENGMCPYTCQCLFAMPSSQPFSVHQQCLLRTFIHECLLFLIVIFHLPGKSSFAQGSVNFTSVQFSIAENQPIGTLVGTIPTLPGLKYRLNPDSAEFALNGDTGVITTKLSLHIESLPTNLLILHVQNFPLPVQHIIEIRITVLRTNERSPVFTPAQTAVAFSQTDGLGTRVSLPTATDGDPGTNGVIVEYSLVAGNELNQFNLFLDNSTDKQQLFLSNSVIFTRQALYILNISAKDGGLPPRFGYLSVNVTVSDTARYSLIFNQSSYAVIVNRSVSLGLVVAQIWATSSNPNARMVYSLLNDANGQFVVNSTTGIITTNNSLLNCKDYCSDGDGCIANTCQLVVEARDSSLTFPLVSRTFVSITLRDDNLQGPLIRFHEQGSLGQIYVDENKKVGTVLEVISITDVDGNPSDVSIVGGNRDGDFVLERSLLRSMIVVKLAKALNRNRNGHYNLTIEARTTIPPIQTSLAFLVIIVNASSKYSLVFDQSFYTSKLSELSQVGSYVAAVRAHLMEVDENVDIMYSILSGNELGWFTINNSTGLVTTYQTLGFKISSSVGLTLLASCGDAQALANLTVTILVGNAEPPIFNYNTYYVTLVESPVPGQLIITVSATYGDGTGPVFYQLDQNVEDIYSRMFQVGEFSGQLVVLKSLDREEFSSFDIRVVAVNGLNPQSSSTATVILNVTGVNDNPPVFDPLFYRVGPLFAPVAKSAIVQLNGSDRDIGGSQALQYSILSGADLNFAIDASTGLMSFLPQATQFTQTLYVVSVNVKDSGDLACPRTATVLILTNNSNASPLKFSNPGEYKFFVVEDDGRFPAKIGRDVGLVQVTESSRTGTLMYCIVDGDPLGIFTIANTTGLLKTNAAVDRESAASYLLTVLVTNATDYGITFVNITVLDVNDNVPRFPSTAAVTDVDENAAIGQDFFAGDAKDPDNGNNGTVLYSLSSNSSDFFTIEDKTGLLRLRKLLDKRSSDRLFVCLIASDLGNPPLVSIQYVTIRVRIVNDHTPIFNDTQYRVVVNESDIVNLRFFCVVATVANTGNFSQITYSISYGNNDGRIKIFPDGCLYIASALDRETTEMYALTVQASVFGIWDNRIATCEVVVVVLDANDNDPVFRNSTYQFAIVENSPAEDFAAMFLASDRDIGRNAELMFSFEGNDNGFRINSMTSLLTSARVFNREQVVHDFGSNVLHLTIAVSDLGLTPRHSHASVDIFILDINDNAPKFLQPAYEFNIPEDAAIGSIVGNVTAKDLDNGQNGSVLYYLMDESDLGLFSIDRRSGILFLLAPLDRETSIYYILEVMAADEGIPISLNSTTIVRIVIRDVKDENPVWINFPADGLEVSCRAEVGEIVGKVEAVDGNAMNRSDVRYGLVYNGPRLFTLDSGTGILSVAQQLDCTQPRTILLNVSAESPRVDPVLFTRDVIPVNILDTNDHMPQFISTASRFHLLEDMLSGYSVFSAEAIDRDLGASAVMAYSILSQVPKTGATFSISETSGLVVSNGSFVKQVNNRYKLVIAASNVGMNDLKISTQRQFIVDIINSNDSIPVIWTPALVVLTTAIPPHTLITTIRATVVQMNSNGKITYEMVGGDVGTFTLDSNSGDLYAGANFSAQPPSYAIVIRASNAYHPTLWSDLHLTILTPTPPSNVGPVFSQATYSGRINENASPGTSILSVFASYPGNPSAILDYFITNITANGQPQKLLFRIDSKTAVISSTDSLDREDGYGSFTLDVYAIDWTSRRTCQTQVFITLVDENDNFPTIVSYVDEFWISESTPVRTVISCIRAFDPDPSSSILYRITSGADDGRIRIDSQTGDLSVLQPLSSMVVSSYDLTVGADDGVHLTEVKVLINIVNSSAQQPMFLLPFYIFDAVEDTPVGCTVGRVSASDRSGRPVRYSLVSQLVDGTFAVDSLSGVLTLSTKMDYEKSRLHTLVVVATRGSANSSVVVYVNVLSPNHNNPVFSSPLYTMDVFENVLPGTSIGRVSTVDLDYDKRYPSIFSILNGDSDNHFQMESNTGVIKVAKPLRHNTRSHYDLIVRVKVQADVDLPQRTATSMVSIIVKSIDVRPPVFVSPNSVVVMENAVVGSSVFQVVAEDLDGGQVSYALVGDEGISATFQIGPTDGVVTLLSHLNRETVDGYRVTVTASISNFGQLAMSYLNMTVIVGDVNDHDPVFDRSSYSATISENALTGVLVLTVSASDLDSGVSGEIRYRVVSGDERSDFLLDSFTGDLSVKWPLSYEIQSAYVLVIIASDLGRPQLSSTATAVVMVTSMHGFTPVFYQSPFVVYAYEGLSSFPIDVAWLNAVDRDVPPFSTLKYQLQNQQDDLPFQINATSGLLICTQALSREEFPEYSLNVIATDSGVPPNTGTGSVRVIVSDANDHAPVFEQDYYTGSVVEKMPLGTTVLKLRANDADLGRNADVRYLLQGDARKFGIDRLTGQIFTTAILNWQAGEIYDLKAMAVDRGLLPQNSTVSVRVKVVDLNDNSPQFLRQNYQTQIRDPTTEGAFVIGITALDLDCGPNGTVVYSILNGSDLFQIDPNNGVITAKRTLTSSGGSSSFVLNVRAEDMGQPPKFNDTQVVVSFLSSARLIDFPSIDMPQNGFLIISEDSSLGSVVTKLSVSSPKGDPLSVGIAGGNVGGVFDVDVQGRVIVKQTLDYRKVSSFGLWVEVRTGTGSTELRSYAMLTINLTETNRNAPEFDRAFYNVSVRDLQAPPLDVIVVHASDRDFSENGNVSYALRPTNDSTAFTIDRNSGLIRTKQTLSYRQATQYRLVVLAMDHGTPIGRTSSVTVLVHIDGTSIPGAPKFADLYLGSIRENSPVGTTVLCVTATDPDPGAIIRYSLLSNPGSRMAIGSGSGVMTTAENFDAEMQSEYLFKIAANDGSFNTETTVTVLVSDENDNVPYCGQKAYYFAALVNQSDGVIVGNVTASDLDVSNPNHDTFFRLRYPDHHLRVNASSGLIYAREPLRFTWRGKNPSPENLWHITLSSVDRGFPPMSSECEVSVQILPKNEFSPMFSEYVIMAAVPSNARPGFEIVRLLARDEDVYPLNAEIHFVLINGSDFFELNGKTGLLTLKSTFQSRMVVQVVAEDGGIPRRSSTAFVNVYICNPDAFYPKFVGSDTNKVAENTRLGEIVTRVGAISTDVVYSGVILYRIVAGNVQGVYSISEVNGSVTLLRSLGNERKRIYVLEIAATMSGTQVRETRKNFTIVVTDVNNGVPKFSQDVYESFIFEGLPIGTIILQLNLTDNDRGANSGVEYKLLGENTVISLFDVDNDSGFITCRGVLDHQDKKEYMFFVEASNTDTNLKSNATVRIHVLAVNQFAPQFTSRSYRFPLSGSVSVGLPVGTIAAVDRDTGYFGRVEYFLVASDDRRGFQLNRTSGVLRISDPSLAVVGASLTAFAKNPGSFRRNSSDICKIFVEINGSVQAPLLFNQSVYQVSVRENASPGSAVLRVFARTGNGEAVVYGFVSGNANGAFGIDAQAGVIRIQNRLSRAAVSFYNVTVTASTSSQSATATVLIIVLDSSGNGTQGYECLTSSPCHNGGSCLKSENGFICFCPFPSRGSRCEIDARGFAPLSYAEYDVSLDAVQNSIFLEIATVQNQSLLLYYSAGKASSLAVEVVAGHLRFSMADENGTVFRVTNTKYISDGQWYRVEVRRQAKVAVLKVGKCQRNGGECDLTLNEDQDLSANLSMASALILSSANPQLLLGGVRDFQNVASFSKMLSSHDFVGCMRNVSVDGYDLFQLQPASKDLNSGTCQRSSVGVCEPNPCLNGGMCVDEWSEFRCNCLSGYTGKTCADAFSSLGFGGGSGIVLWQKEQYRRDQLLKELSNSRRKRGLSSSAAAQNISFEVRTNESKGMLFYSESPDSYTLLQVDEGNVVYKSGNQILRNPATLSDSRWHNVSFGINDSSILLIVDMMMVSETFPNPVHDPLGLSVSAISIAAVRPPVSFDVTTSPGFAGCISSVRFNGQLIPVIGETERFTIEQFGTIQLECNFPVLPGASGASVGSLSWKTPVIVVCALVGFLLLSGVLLLSVFCHRQRKKRRRGENGDVKIRGDFIVHQNGCAEGTVIENHAPKRPVGIELSSLQQEKDSNAQVLPTPPDVLVTETVLSPPWLQNGFDNVGYSGEIPGQHDTENSSSIAPSDLADIVSHYKRHRNGALKTYDRNHIKTPPDSGLTSSLKRKSAGYEASNYLVPVPNHQQFLTGPRKQNHEQAYSSNILDKPGLRMAGMTKMGGNKPNVNSTRSTPQSGIGEVFSSGLNGRNSPDRHSGLPKPALAGTRWTPMVGLTLEDVNQLSSSNRQSPADAIDTSSLRSDRIPKNIINTTDFTHDDLFQSKMPQIAENSSSDEEERADTFTCSEFEINDDRLRNKFRNPYQKSLAPLPSLVRSDSRHDTEQTGGHGAVCQLNSNSDSTREDNLSMGGDMKSPTAFFNETQLNFRALNDNYLLNWGPNFEKLVGLCIEIAQLPEPEEHVKISCRTPPRSSKIPAIPKYNSRSVSNPQFKDPDRRPSSLSPPSHNWKLRSSSNPQFGYAGSRHPVVSPHNFEYPGATETPWDSKSRPTTGDPSTSPVSRNVVPSLQKISLDGHSFSMSPPLPSPQEPTGFQMLDAIQEAGSEGIKEEYV